MGTRLDYIPGPITLSFSNGAIIDSVQFPARNLTALLPIWDLSSPSIHYYYSLLKQFARCTFVPLPLSPIPTPSRSNGPNAFRCSLDRRLSKREGDFASDVPRAKGTGGRGQKRLLNLLTASLSFFYVCFSFSLDVPFRG